MTDSITFGGFHYLFGQKVSVFLADLDCGTYLPDKYGQIVVPMGSDPDGLLSAGWLASHSNPGAYGDAEVYIPITDVNANALDCYVPLVVGLAFDSRGQCLRPFDQNDLKSQKGPGLAKKKRIHMIGALVSNTAGISFGTDFGDMQRATFRDKSGAALPQSAQYSGVYWDTLPDDYGFDTMLAWEISRPYPAVLNQIGGFLNSEDE